MDKEKIMQQWDYHRSRIAEDNWGGASEPRDWFESIIEWIVELEAENDKLRGLTVKLARECFDDGYDAGMERAAELKEQVRVDCSAMPNSSIDAALQHYERAIRAELEK